MLEPDGAEPLGDVVVLAAVVVVVDDGAGVALGDVVVVTLVVVDVELDVELDCADSSSESFASAALSLVWADVTSFPTLWWPGKPASRRRSPVVQRYVDCRDRAGDLELCIRLRALPTPLL